MAAAAAACARAVADATVDLVDFLSKQKYVEASVNLCPLPLFQANSAISWDASMKKSDNILSLRTRSDNLWIYAGGKSNQNE